MSTAQKSFQRRRVALISRRLFSLQSWSLTVEEYLSLSNGERNIWMLFLTLFAKGLCGTLVRAACYQCRTTKKRIIAVFVNTACGISQTSTERPCSFPRLLMEGRWSLISSLPPPHTLPPPPPPFAGPEASD